MRDSLVTPVRHVTCSLYLAHSVLLLLTGEIMPPQRPDLILSAHIPDIEFRVLIGDCFDVEADGGDCGDVLV